MLFYICLLNLEFLLALNNNKIHNQAELSKFNKAINNNCIKEEYKEKNIRKLQGNEYSSINLKYHSVCIEKMLKGAYVANAEESANIYNESINKAVEHMKKLINVKKRNINLKIMLTILFYLE